MMRKSLKIFLIILFSGSLSLLLNKEVSLYAQNHSESTSNPNVGFDLEEYILSIPEIMEENEVPGLSIAVMNRESIIKADAFGVRDKTSGESVNEETIFSLQSISKTVTATAVMFAVQEGLVELDTPITEYLPNFKVNSRFETSPEQKITLRHLLSHRAGFTHEAPIGNNYQNEFDSFKQHAESISDTWLKFPVGQQYSYSNLGIDLAGYILQVKSGIPFAEYVKTRLFDPLEMKSSSFNWKEIRNNENRAIGHSNFFNNIPLEYALIPSGGCYTNVLDMSKFIQFHLNHGKHRGRVLLQEEYLNEMYRVPFSGKTTGYGLGVDIFKRDGELCFNHGGGGFGFLTIVNWYPHLDIGVVILTNSTSHNNTHGKISGEIVNKISLSKISRYKQSSTESSLDNKNVIQLSGDEYSHLTGEYVTSGGKESFEVIFKDSLFGGQIGDMFVTFNFTSHKGDFYVEGFGDFDGVYRFIIDDKTGEPACILNTRGRAAIFYNGRIDSHPGPNKQEWKELTGEYSIKMYDKVISKPEIKIRNGYLFYNNLRLREHLPGLFYASNGEVVDFRGEIPTYRNIKLFR
jgi:CubicO group peptidase (beta-lactamase class C family)